METIVVKISQSSKVKSLIEMLKSMDFVSNVAYFDKLEKANSLFDEVNKLSQSTELASLSLEEINKEISDSRDGK